MKKWTTIAVIGAIGLTLPLLGAPVNSRDIGQRTQSPTKFQIIDAHFEDAVLQDQGGIVKINTTTGETWRYLAGEGRGGPVYYWVPVETLKEVPRRTTGEVKATWKKLDAKF